VAVVARPASDASTDTGPILGGDEVKEAVALRLAFKLCVPHTGDPLLAAHAQVARESTRSYEWRATIGWVPFDSE
jgi:hypothetical protein